MAAIEPPQASYTLTVDVQIEGLTAPLQVHAATCNDLRKAVRLLQANNFLVPQCPAHPGRPMKPSKNGKGWYCSAKVGDGYCTEKVG